MIGKRVLVRGNRSGVFFGTLVYQNGAEVKLYNCRKLYYWDGACAVEELSLNGTANPENCKFTVFVDSLIVSDMIQMILCTEISINSIESVKEWKQE